jgi:DNA (cytosine-5)-methyltransferase 1
VELDPVAAATYARNLGKHVFVGDIRRTVPHGRCDVLVAGPPCQGFSTLGKRDPRDPRNALALEVYRWAQVLRPSIVVIENVAAFLDSEAWRAVRRRFERAGYEVWAGTFDALEFGTPQLRKRSFTFASRVGIPVVRRENRKGPATVREAWEGLSTTPDGRNHHTAPAPSGLALARMRAIPPGGDKRDVMRRLPRLAPKSWWSLKCQATDVWGRMEWDRPSNTLRTALQNASKGRYIHPEQHRVISLREAARLQAIPDGWQFEGLPYPIARQIGNSVPPTMGRAVARSVREALRA